MKHLATTTEKEVIVTLNMAEINTLLMLTNSASIRYEMQIKTSIDPEGRRIQMKEADDWWKKLYELRKNL